MIKVTLEIDDCRKLEKLHYEVNALADLVNRLALQIIQPVNAEGALKKYMELYTEKFKEYEDYKAVIDAKYKPDGEFKSWSVDFNERQIIFEE